MRAEFMVVFMVGFVRIVCSQSLGYQPAAATLIQDSIQQYYTLSSLPMNHLKPGEIIAVPYVTQAPVVDAVLTTGKLPPGTSLYPNGLLVVNNSQAITVGTYSFTFETTLANGEVRTHRLQWQVAPGGGADRDAIFFVSNKKKIGDYVNGELLAHAHDPDGEVISAVAVRGALPKGTSLTRQGDVVVADKHQLEAGVYNVWIVTTDAQQGVSLFVLTLDLKHTLAEAH